MLLHTLVPRMAPVTENDPAPIVRGAQVEKTCPYGYDFYGRGLHAVSSPASLSHFLLHKMGLMAPVPQGIFKGYKQKCSKSVSQPLTNRSIYRGQL